MDLLKQKLEIFREVEPILELLREVHLRLDGIPRTNVASRQLHLLIAKLASWKTTFEPLQIQEVPGHTPEPPSMPTLDEMQRAMKKYGNVGFYGLTDREKLCVLYFDRQARKQA